MAFATRVMRGRGRAHVQAYAPICAHIARMGKPAAAAQSCAIPLTSAPLLKTAMLVWS